MCILIYLPSGEQPDIGALMNAQDNNPDGFGFAIVVPDQDDGTKDRIVIGRGMDATDVRDRFVNARRLYPDGPALFHARIATAGSLKKQNCHPFYVGDDKRTVIAHNGILPRKSQPTKDDYRSDTRLLAERWLPANRFGSLNSKRGLKALSRWAGTYNKFVILSVNPRYHFRAVIVNESAGSWDTGIWYSNDSYEDWYGKWSYKSYGGSNSALWDESSWNWDNWDDQTKRFILDSNRDKKRSVVTAGTKPGILCGDDELAAYESASGSAVYGELVCDFCYAKGQISNVSHMCWACCTCQNCSRDIENCQCSLREDYWQQPDESEHLSIKKVIQSLDNPTRQLWE